MRVGSLGWEDPLKEEMATHSSILSWRIPWTEEPGGLHSNMIEHASDFLSTGVYWVCWWMVTYVIYSKAADPEEPHEI